MPVERSGAKLLTGERTTLKFLHTLCSVASDVKRYVDAPAGTGTLLRNDIPVTGTWICCCSARFAARRRYPQRAQRARRLLVTAARRRANDRRIDLPLVLAEGLMRT